VDQYTALRLLETGKHDAALLGNFQGLHLINEHNLRNVKLRSTGIEPQKYAIAVSRGNEELMWLLNQGLYQMKANGTYDELYEKWFSVYEEYFFINKYKILIISVSGILALLILFVVLLRYRINRSVHKLAASELNFKKLVETAAVPMVVSDRSEQVILANKKFTELFGYTTEEHTSVNDWWRLAYPDENYRKFVSERWKDAIEESANTNTAITPQEVMVTCKNGEIRYVEVGFTALDNLNLITFVDITHHKELQAELNEKSEELERYFDSSLDLLCIANTRGEFERLNPEWENVLGYSIAELEEKVFLDFVHPDDLQVTKDAISKLESLQEVLSFENRYRCKDGTYRWIEWRSKPLGNKVYAAARDVTDRKLAEIKLRESEEKYREMADMLPQVVFETDEKGNLVFLNKQAYTVFGYPEDFEVIGQSTVIFHSPDERSRVMANVKYRLAGKTIENNEYTMLRKDGSTFQALVYSSPILKNGTPAGLRGIIVDINDRKLIEIQLRESEEKFSKAFRNSPDIIIISKLPDGKIIDANDTMKLLGGYSREEIIGKTTTELQLWANKADRDYFIEKLMTEKRISSFESKFRAKSGKIYSGLISGEIIHLKEGQCILSVLHDISARKLAEQKIRDSEARLRELNATKDKFFSIIAHDLKNPFNSIIGFSNLLKEDARNLDVKEIEDYAGIISSAATNTLQLLDNLLEWARIQQGSISFNPRLLVLYEMVNEAVGVVQNSSQQKKINLLNHVPAHIIIKADENMIKTLIRNLLTNAIKFSHPGSEVEVSALAENESVQVSVADKGVGISEENIDKLFQISSDIKSRGTNNEHGTGLGLILCKEFVEKHGGKIWVESKEGTGSTFYFNLPSNAEQEEKTVSQNEWPPEKANNEDLNLKIMIVADDDVSGMLLKTNLKRLSNEILIARTGIEAVEACRNNPDIDLVLMDIRMPEMSGYPAIRQIRQFNAEVIIIALTAFTLAGEREKSAEAGCNDYISKPIQIDKLMEMIQKYFQRLEDER
jgi:PAS domain S-box-containing protein